MAMFCTTLMLTLCTTGLIKGAFTSYVSIVSQGVHDIASNDSFSKLILSETASVRYRKPGLICETTAGVQEFVGFVDLNDNAGNNATASYFFWFSEARHSADTAPLTIWLNGGPGSDSLLGLFGAIVSQETNTPSTELEIGPCKVTDGLNTTFNPHSWSEVSNILFLSQPVGVGFSYQSQNGRRSSGWVTDTTEKAAAQAWDVLQTFMHALSTMDPVITTKTVHLWTESYGGHYGPKFAANNTYNISLVPDEGAYGEKR
ncbi:hypothetical protein SPBR_07490 [Sporothrix brasiliensis 5110]|uniref:Carboxypeptidase n=1 Tax=Sporothrix brasiliensis 5110 TaxID=1398154 RepID=A0A0C2FBP9_9PEZI|nr:uncharacterized protein SPBR_07490 [Sporothrix brasiliensis 5110]KIH88503.1 hypothetical protein SPBR_07490 [Sporothrix brasiliensis 5110]